jgi:hypothetical protein
MHLNVEYLIAQHSLFQFLEPSGSPTLQSTFSWKSFAQELTHEQLVQVQETFL